MKKRIIILVVMIALVFTLTGCWPGEVGFTTTINADGSGNRTLVLDVMDDTLSSTPITNPDDPDGSKGNGPVINNEHITGGLPAIQTWLVANAPNFITVQPMKVENTYHRIYTLTWSWSSIDEFMTQYQTLVNLSPNQSWSDFTDQEKPSITITGAYQKTVTFSESNAILQASYDWAVDGIWNSIYDAADLAGYVTKADITALAGYTLNINGQQVDEHAAYDPTVANGDYFGKVVYLGDDTFTGSGVFTNTGLLIGTIVGAVVVVAGGGALAFVLLKKK